jgi:hypothetical protein
MVSLDLDGVVLDGATGPAQTFQFPGQRIERRTTLRQSANDRYDLAAATTALTEDSDDAVVRNGSDGLRRPCAPTRRSAPERLIAVPAQILPLPAIGAIHQSIVCHSLSIYVALRSGVTPAGLQFV